LSAALQTGLTAYDAAYWLVARTLSAELVTLDQARARCQSLTKEPIASGVVMR
jgi:predicted nucleic acid-binding protein